MQYSYNIEDFPIIWRKYDPIRSVVMRNPVLKDLEEHMPANHIYRDQDLVTWAHETTHGLNSILRNQNGGTGSVNAFYCMNDHYVVFKEPKMKLSKVEQYVPVKYKNHMLFDLYLVQQQKNWNDEPLYIIDEWIAYTNGSLVGERTDTIESMLVFNFYATALITAINEHDPDYIEAAPLKDFMLWQIGRTYKIAENTNYKSLLDDLTNTYFN